MAAAKKKGADWRSERLKRVVLGAQLSAAKRVAGLFLDEKDASRNPDAAKTWNECSVATRAAIELTKGTMALERAKAANGGADGPMRVFGIAVVPARIADRKDWERLAQEAERPAIEAQVVEKKDPEQ